jgi:RNA polymerase sigma-70 factor, ECF subfamily
VASRAELDEVHDAAFAAAYRMLGSVADAEDVAQETTLRLHIRAEMPTSPAAWATTVATRIAIDVLRSARASRESYVGEWLPEPLITDCRDDPARSAEHRDSLSTAFLVLLERLSPAERAAFLLREVFDHPYREIATALGRSEQAVRQLVSRARRHIDADRPRFEADRAAREALAARFFAAVEADDAAELGRLLATDIRLHGDGGGKAPAARHPVTGRARAVRTLLGWAALARRAGTTLTPTQINGQPGAIGRTGGLISHTMALDITRDGITAVRVIVNPDKLAHLNRTPSEVR